MTQPPPGGPGPSGDAPDERSSSEQAGSGGPEATGHGSALPYLKHGGPGRAGGGEELGGLRAVKHLMQRAGLQGSPAMLAAVTGEGT